jgi:outer membrane protein assembly factor BamD (BamD/ComL family)
MRSTRSRLAAERALLEAARASIRTGDLATATRKLRTHQRDFARGELVEEREVLWIHALKSKGDAVGAQKRAEAFRRRYPHSLFLPAVDSIVPVQP